MKALHMAALEEFNTGATSKPQINPNSVTAVSCEDSFATMSARQVMPANEEEFSDGMRFLLSVHLPLTFPVLAK